MLFNAWKWEMTMLKVDSHNFKWSNILILLFYDSINISGANQMESEMLNKLASEVFHFDFDWFCSTHILQRNFHYF